jgi:hypothetical protein
LNRRIPSDGRRRRDDTNSIFFREIWRRGVRGGRDDEQ